VARIPLVPSETEMKQALDQISSFGDLHLELKSLIVSLGQVVFSADSDRGLVWLWFGSTSYVDIGPTMDNATLRLGSPSETANLEGSLP
jgi:hypothetical protein